MICLVTDRLRLSGGAPFESARRCLAEQARHAVEAEVDLIQLRERDLDGRQLALLADDLVRATRGSRTRVVVNDRLDVALASGADGVHLRSASISAGAVRRLAPEGFVVGQSVHGALDVEAVGPVDYVIAGTVFASDSKSGAPALLGIAGLKAIVHASRVPVLAIGGIGLERLPDVAASGAAGVAAIGLFMAVSDTGRTRRAACGALPLASVAAAVRAAFDRSDRAS